MAGTYTSFFIVALISFQDLHGYVVKSNNKTSLDDVMQKLVEFLQKIRDDLHNITYEPYKLIAKLEDKIMKIFNGLELASIVQKIKDSIMNILGQTGEVVEHCLNEQHDHIEHLAVETKELSVQCVDKAKNNLDDIQKEWYIIVEKANALLNDIMTRAKKCIADTSLDVEGIVQCLKDQMGPLSEEIDTAKSDIMKHADVVIHFSQETTSELDSCISDVASYMVEKEKPIITEINNCIDSYIT